MTRAEVLQLLDAVLDLARQARSPRPFSPEYFADMEVLRGCIDESGHLAEDLEDYEIQRVKSLLLLFTGNDPRPEDTSAVGMVYVAAYQLYKALFPEKAV